MRRSFLIRAMLLLKLLSDHADPAHAQTSPEYQVKMAYLYKFSKFVDWPTRTFADSSAPLAGLLHR